MLQIYGPARSRVTRVLWTVEELGIPYELNSLNMREGENRKAPFTDINPIGKVPAIVDGDLKLSESAAILNYLADKNAGLGKNLIPAAGTKDRALHDQWMFFAVSELEAPIWAWFKQFLFVKEELRSKDLHEEAKSCSERGTAVLSKHLSDRSYMVGEEFGVVDILTTGILNWAKFCQLPVLDETLLAYMKRNMDRPAYQRMAAQYLQA